MKKKIISISFIVLFTLFTVYMIVTSEDIMQLSHILDTIDYRYVFIGVLCLFGYLVINSMIMYTISKKVTTKIRRRDALFLTFVEQYYSLITPSASGGQPAQVLYMNSKYGISHRKGTTICIKKLMIYQMTVAIYAIIMFLVSYKYIMSKSLGIIVMVIIGLLVNFVIGVVILLMSCNASLLKRIFRRIIGFAHKLRLFKKVGSESIDSHIDEYVKDLEEIRNNKAIMAKLFLLTFLQLTLYFIVPFFTYYALGETRVKPLTIIPIQTVVYVVSSIIPTPGGAGAAEGSYYLLFNSIVGADILVYSMALWRIIVYYMNMIISGIVILVEKIVLSTKKDKSLLKG